MRVTTLSMLGLLLAAGLASAQTPPADSTPAASNPAAPMNRLDRMAILLDLTPQQKLEFQQVFQEQRQQMQAFWQQQKASGVKPNFQQLRAERQQLRQQTIAQLDQLLTTDSQRAKLQVLMTPQFRHHWRHRPGSAGSGSSSSSAAQ